MGLLEMDLDFGEWAMWMFTAGLGVTWEGFGKVGQMVGYEHNFGLEEWTWNGFNGIEI